MIMEKNNRANFRALNEMNKTALHYASSKRNRDFGWNTEVSHVVSYKEVAKQFRSKEYDSDDS